jgi:DNA-binding NarL/FixJ family response regulator
MPARVLLVDDDVHQLELRADVMKVSGFSVTTTCDPLEAISIMSNPLQQIDVVVLDYDMPVMDGCTLATRLRSLRPEVKIILYSGKVDIPRSKMASVDVFVPKTGGVGPLIGSVVKFTDLITTSSSSAQETVGTSSNPPRTPGTRILIADDHVLMLSFITKLLGKNYDVVGAVPNGQALLDEIGRLSPDMAVVDIGMPGLNGVEVARRIGQLRTRPRLVFLTVYEDAELVQSALSVGVLGYVVKCHVLTDLPSAVQSALQGQQFVSPCVQDRDRGKVA